MTEADWSANTSSKRMIRFLRRPLADRKMILFAVACCRRLGEWLVDPRSRDALMVLEQFADRKVSRKELHAAARSAAAAATEVDSPRVAMDHLRYGRSPEAETAEFEHEYRRVSRLHYAGFAVDEAMSCSKHLRETPDFLLGSTQVLMRCQNALCGDGPVAGPEAEEDAFGVDAPRLSESKYQADVVRDIFGNPFHPVTVDRSWLTWNNSTILKIAQTIYDERGFDELPVLADALEEGGCTNRDILNHCRQGGEHVRGCWVVDSILGRE